MTASSEIGNSSIYLVGFMASGKSTVGPALAARLCMEFIDLDRIIEMKMGCTIAQLIEREGEGSFRQIETEALGEVSQGTAAVIAPGGGAITREENVKLMAASGTRIWLDAPFELCWRRIEQDRNQRPLAPDEPTARSRYEQRLPLYRQADIQIIIGESQSPHEIVESIIDQLSRQD